MEVICNRCQGNLSNLKGDINFCPYCCTPVSNSCTQCDNIYIEDEFAYCPSCGSKTDYGARGIVNEYVPF